MINEASKAGDGHVTFEDFFKVMRKKCNDPLNEFDSDEEERDNKRPQATQMLKDRHWTHDYILIQITASFNYFHYVV